jgi:predicted O-methyltransferase YrrM
MRFAEYWRSLFLLGKAAIMGANARSLGHIFEPRAFSQYTREVLFLHDTMFGRKLPAQNVDALFPSSPEADIKLNCAESGWSCVVPSATADIVNLCLLARLASPKVVFEIGTMSGATALHFALNAPDAEIYTLDLPPDGVPALGTTLMDNEYVKTHRLGRTLILDSHPAGKRIVCLYGDSAKFDFSAFRARVDLFFIDGAHSYEYVKNDTLRALECCRPGGIIAWHDYGRHGVNGVSKWLHELSATHKIYCIPGGSLAYMRVNF